MAIVWPRGLNLRLSATSGSVPHGRGLVCRKLSVASFPEAADRSALYEPSHIDAPTALQAGLVSRIVAEDALASTAQQIAQRIAGHAPLAVRAVKEVAQAALDQTLDQSLRLGSTLRWIIGQTEDAQEGPRAFAERREARFQGQ